LPVVPPSQPSPTQGAGQASPWDPKGPVAPLVRESGLVTVVEGSCFCLSDRAGDIHPAAPHGLFMLDSRVLSRWELTIDGARLESLTAASDAPYETTFVGRVRPGPDEADSDVLVFRERHVGQGMRERIRVHNYGSAEVSLTLRIDVDVDLASVFAVKEARPTPRESTRLSCEPSRWSFAHQGNGAEWQTAIDVSPDARPEHGAMVWPLVVAPRDVTEVCIEVSLAVGQEQIEPRFRCGHPDRHAEPARRHTAWKEAAPGLDTDSAALKRAFDQAIEDLGALRIFDPEHPEQPVIAAGAPWFMTLFGRDALITSWMALLVDPSLAQGVLETLARFQGTEVDDRTEEEPGRILHEVRFEQAPSLAFGGASSYFGTADATPLFVMLTGELRRWGLADDAVARLLPHVDRALEWIENYGDRDGDGYVEYARRSPTGLVNQGWKDSWDGVSFADGRLPEAPVALCEVQGYTYAAYLARAHFAQEAGDDVCVARYRDKAAALKEAFNRDFWLEDQGWFAMGLDADKQPIDALASNVGHCLWTGIADEDKARRVADHLLSPAMFSGWGIRTLATTMARYNPVSYHNGSVWPHDTAICAAGLMRYGFADDAMRVVEGLLDVVSALDGRLPELFAGLDRSELPVPVPYPTSCSPQAWAAAAPLLMLRTVLRLDPWTSRQRIHLAPVAHAGAEMIRLRGVQVGQDSVDIDWEGSTLTVTGAPHLEVVEHPRPPLHHLGTDTRTSGNRPSIHKRGQRP
jgi:glycogen debranching enzyme